MNTEDKSEIKKSEIKKIITNQKKNTRDNSKLKKTKIERVPEKTTNPEKTDKNISIKKTHDNITGSEITRPPVIGLPLPFIISLYNVILLTNRRGHWEPNELIPVGNMIGQLENIIKTYSEPSATEPPITS